MKPLSRKPDVPRRVLIVSPPEPSGVTWVVNCLLELNVRCFRHGVAKMWEETDGRSRLRPAEHVLRQFLPALSDHPEFRFRTDLEVEWTHDWPTQKRAHADALLWMRDPRNSLASRHAREYAHLGLREFVESRDPATLLRRIPNWCLFTHAWLDRTRFGVLRFEDYKQDAPGTLREVLARLGVPAGEAEIARAVEASDFRRAAEAERRYRAEVGTAGPVINRSGAVGGWHEAADASVVEEIGREAAPLLRRLGYPAPEPTEGEAAWQHYPSLGLLPFFKGVSLPDLPGRAHSDPDPALEAWARQLSWEQVCALGLGGLEIRRMTTNLAGYFVNAGRPPPALLAGLAARAGREAEYHLDLFRRTRSLGELLRAGRCAVARWLRARAGAVASVVRRAVRRTTGRAS